jgi:uncharacterized protein (DUF58 family)
MKLIKKYERIYCFPNGLGGVAFGLFVVCILAGATYANNLVFILAFILISFGLILIMQTARSIRSVKILSLRVEGGIKDDIVNAEVVVMNPTPIEKLNIQLSVQWAGQDIVFVIPYIGAKTTATAKTSVKINRPRGVYPVRRIKVSSTYPYGLFNAWKYEKWACDIIVYPTPLGSPLKVNTESDALSDFSRHKPYEWGDPLSRVDWKVYFRRQQLFVREFNDDSIRQVNIKFSDTIQKNAEEKLSQLSLWLLQAESWNATYSLHLPNKVIPLSRSSSHMIKCLTELARWEISEFKNE